MSSLSQFAGEGGVPLGSYTLFSSNSPNLIQYSDGKTYLKSGVLAKGSDYPQVPSDLVDVVAPVTKVSDIGSGVSISAIGIIPDLGFPVLYGNHSWNGYQDVPTLTIRGLSTTSSNDCVVGSSIIGINSGSNYRINKVITNTPTTVAFVSSDGSQTPIGNTNTNARRGPLTISASLTGQVNPVTDINSNIVYGWNSSSIVLGQLGGTTWVVSTAVAANSQVFATNIVGGSGWNYYNLPSTRTLASIAYMGGNGTIFTGFTVTGDVRWDTQSPFTGGGVPGYSMVFDGVNDLIQQPWSSQNQIASSQFVYETWIRPTSIAGVKIICHMGWGFGLYINNGYLGVFLGTEDATQSFFINQNVTSTAAITVNNWHHIAVYRDSANTIRVAFNGTIVATYNNYSYNISIGNYGWTFGNYRSDFGYGDSYSYVGSISNPRLVIGSCHYGSSNFTPPTAPLTSITNTRLLLQPSSADIAVACFVAVPTGSNLGVRTVNGTSWSNTTLPQSASWSVIECNNDATTNKIFVALARNTAVAATSPDGVTWTQRTLPATANWDAVAWSNTLGLWCAIAYDSNIAATSPDGVTWTQRTLPATAGWTDIKWSPGLSAFIIVSDDGRGGVAFSTDGINWSLKLVPKMITFERLVSNGTDTLFAIEATFGLPVIARSTDSGVTWTYNKPNIWMGRRTLAPSSSGLVTSGNPTEPYLNFRWLNGALRAATPNGYSIDVYSSTDGITWSSVNTGTGNSTLYADSVNDIVWTGSAYLMVGSQGEANLSVVWRSTDGTTWSMVNTPSGMIPKALATYPNGVVHLMGYEPTAGNDYYRSLQTATSTNHGLNWANATTNTFNSSGYMSLDNIEVYQNPQRNFTVVMTSYRGGQADPRYFCWLTTNNGTSYNTLNTITSGSSGAKYSAIYGSWFNRNFSNGLFTTYYSLGICSAAEDADFNYLNSFTGYNASGLYGTKYSYSIGVGFKNNSKISTFLTSAVIPAYLGNVQYYTNGTALYTPDLSGKYINNLLTGSVGSLNNYMRVK